MADSIRENLKNKRSDGLLAQFQFKDAFSGSFQFEDSVYPCHLVDLPCLIETYKTFDNSSYYKSADVHQMVVVSKSDKLDPPPRRYPSGLTIPTEGIRARYEKVQPPPREILAEVESRLSSIGKNPREKYELVQIEETDEDAEDEYSDDEIPPLQAYPHQSPTVSSNVSIPRLGSSRGTFKPAMSPAGLSGDDDDSMLAGLHGPIGRLPSVGLPRAEFSKPSSVQAAPSRAPEPSSVQAPAFRAPEPSSVQAPAFRAPEPGSVQAAAFRAPEPSSVQAAPFRAPVATAAPPQLSAGRPAPRASSTETIHRPSSVSPVQQQQPPQQQQSLPQQPPPQQQQQPSPQPAPGVPHASPHAASPFHSSSTPVSHTHSTPTHSFPSPYTAPSPTPVAPYALPTFTSQAPAQTPTTTSVPFAVSSTSTATPTTSTATSMANVAKKAELASEISKLQRQIADTEENAKSLSNMIMRKRKEAEAKKFREELEQKQKELDALG